MSYGVIVSFHLQPGTAGNYRDAYAAAAQLGLQQQPPNTSTATLATSTLCIGQWEGPDQVWVCEDVMAKLRAAFDGRPFEYEVFLSITGPDLERSIVCARLKPDGRTLAT